MKHLYFRNCLWFFIPFITKVIWLTDDSLPAQLPIVEERAWILMLSANLWEKAECLFLMLWKDLRTRTEAPVQWVVGTGCFLPACLHWPHSLCAMLSMPQQSNVYCFQGLLEIHYFPRNPSGKLAGGREAGINLGKTFSWDIFKEMNLFLLVSTLWLRRFRDSPFNLPFLTPTLHPDRFPPYYRNGIIL